MPDRLSKSQIDKLGERLRDAEEISVEDLTVLQRVRSEHDAAMAVVADRLADELGLEPGSRLKTVGTIVDKLRREHIRLSQMQDIAGVRVVRAMGLGEQDDLVRSIVDLFDRARVVDRRERPSHGYRAVHVIAVIEGRNVEIQVRTELQHLWAQAFEAIADLLGRDIRYGLSPGPVVPLSAAETSLLVETWHEQSAVVAEIEMLDQELATEEHNPNLRRRLERVRESASRTMQTVQSSLSMGESSL